VTAGSIVGGRCRGVVPLLLVTSVLVGCGAFRASSGLNSSYPLRTLPSPGPNDICQLALAGGVLAFDPTSGLGLQSQQGAVLPVYWPFGYRAGAEGTDIFLFDGSGAAVARVGDRLQLTGGYGPDNVSFSMCQSKPVRNTTREGKPLQS
jgi:hypothetical protein